jgi:cysteine desulfurase
MTARPIYMDNHSTTCVDPRVVDVMLPYFTENYGNAASIDHDFGREAAEAVDNARTQIAELLRVDPRDLIFTSGATEANNLAIKGVMQAAGTGSHLVTTAAEHRAVLDPARKLGRNGFEVTIVDVDRFGMVDPQRIADAIQPNTTLVSVMLANNEVGTINPIEAIGNFCRERNVLLHTDAVQAVGKISLDLSQFPVDLASLTAHKFHGPKGIGVLYVRRG